MPETSEDAEAESEVEKERGLEQVLAGTKSRAEKKKDETGKDTEVETRARTSIDAEERAGAEVEGLSNCKLTWYIPHLGLQVQMAHHS